LPSLCKNSLSIESPDAPIISAELTIEVSLITIILLKVLSSHKPHKLFPDTTSNVRTVGACLIAHTDKVRVRVRIRVTVEAINREF
jgi:hypothetical protein